ncbi:MAG: nuclear transport factor 2 family protein [Xanthomonadales bacterium]|nr:nuclear transport factor 2 family protein [Xanthomonadales bacterium]
MEAKIEGGERRAFMEHIGAGFTAQDGRMNRDQVRALVVFQLNRYERLQGQLFPISVLETGPETAEAKFRALVTGGPNWIPDSGQVYDFETTWRLEDGDWLLVSANWDPVPLDEVLDKLPLPSNDP